MKLPPPIPKSPKMDAIGANDDRLGDPDELDEALRDRVQDLPVPHGRKGSMTYCAVCGVRWSFGERDVACPQRRPEGHRWSEVKDRRPLLLLAGGKAK